MNDGYCFLIDGISYLAVIASLLLIRVAYDRPKGNLRPPILIQLKDGWSYVSTYVPFAISSCSSPVRALWAGPT